MTKSLIKKALDNHTKASNSAKQAMLYAIKSGDAISKLHEDCTWNDVEGKLKLFPGGTVLSIFQARKYARLSKNKHLALVLLDEEKPFNLNELNKALSDASPEEIETAEIMRVAEEIKQEQKAIEKEQKKVLSTTTAISDTGEVVEVDEIEVKKVVGVGAHSNTEDDEWYTPSCYIESARKVMGSIDVDVASNDLAQKTVKASRYFTEDDSSLDIGVNWSGNIWMNPPYSRIIKDFCGKLKIEVELGNVKQAITLTNNGTDTAWFHDLASVSSAICHHKGRIGFIKQDGETVSNNTKGQLIIYIGDDIASFKSEFSKYGVIYVK